MPPSRRVFHLIFLLFVLLLLFAFGACFSPDTLPRFFQVVIKGLNNFDYVPAP
jgi:hypothetical protein